MKLSKLIAASFCLLFTSYNASAEQAKARLMYTDGSNDDVLIIRYRNGSVSYRLNERDLNQAVAASTKLDAIYFYKPAIFTEAMDLYNGRKYAEAKAKFAQCEEMYKAVDTAPNNYATLAGFYKLECNRRMFNLDALSKELEKFRSQALTRENDLRQIELYAFWEAVRLKDWARLDLLAKSWQKRRVTGNQRSQIAYCHGLALEQLAKKDPKLLSKALNAYNRALTADFGASVEIVVDACHRLLRIYESDPEVKLAIKLWGTEDERKASNGYQRLLEANTLVKFYNQAGLPAIKSLTDAQKNFLKYEAKEDDLAAAEDDSDDEEKDE